MTLYEIIISSEHAHTVNSSAPSHTYVVRAKNSNEAYEKAWAEYKKLGETVTDLRVSHHTEATYLD